MKEVETTPFGKIETVNSVVKIGNTKGDHRVAFRKDDLETVVIDDKTREMYEKAFDPELGWWTKTRLFLSAESRAGRKAKIVKDFIFTLAPIPHKYKIKSATEFIGKQIGIPDIKKKDMGEDSSIKKVFKRALTKDSESFSFIRVRDDDGKLSAVALGATAIRIILFLGVLWLAEQMGIPVAKVITAASAVFG